MYTDSLTNSAGVDLPPIPDELIAALDERYPDRWPDIKLPDREIWYQAGQRSVINMLLDQHRRQREADKLEGGIRL